MLISIESEELETIQKKDGSGNYQKQSAYVHLVEKDGSPKRYPTETSIFPNRDPAGNSIAYKKGMYELADTSFRLDRYGNLELGFVNLNPVARKQGQ